MASGDCDRNSRLPRDGISPYSSESFTLDQHPCLDRYLAHIDEVVAAFRSARREDHSTQMGVTNTNSGDPCATNLPQRLSPACRGESRWSSLVLPRDRFGTRRFQSEEIWSRRHCCNAPGIDADAPIHLCNYFYAGATAPLINVGEVA